MADVVYGDFVWDDDKNKANKKAHGVSFELASRVVFDDALMCEYDDVNSSMTEDRYKLIGLVNGVMVLLVAVTQRGNKTRIISARRATKTEVRKYEKKAYSI